MIANTRSPALRFGGSRAIMDTMAHSPFLVLNSGRRIPHLVSYIHSLNISI